MQGEAVSGIYLIGEGSVGVHATKPDRLLVELKGGRIVRRNVLSEKTKASATIRAESRATKLIVFLHTDLTELIDKDPSLGKGLFQGIALQLSQKLRHTTGKLAEELASEQKLLAELDQAGDSTSSRADARSRHRRASSVRRNAPRRRHRRPRRVGQKMAGTRRHAQTNCL